MPKILSPGYENAVRVKLGLSIDDLPDSEINIPSIVDLAEATIIKKIPDYVNITDATDKLFLENAVINYICYLLCYGMSARFNVEVKLIDTAWKKQPPKWEDLANKFLEEAESSLNKISSYVGINGVIFAIAPGPTSLNQGG